MSILDPITPGGVEAPGGDVINISGTSGTTTTTTAITLTMTFELQYNLDFDAVLGE